VIAGYAVLRSADLEIFNHYLFSGMSSAVNRPYEFEEFPNEISSPFQGVMVKKLAEKYFLWYLICSEPGLKLERLLSITFDCKKPHML
jgi:hypothetical protein